MLRRLNWVMCYWQLREVAIDEGVKSTDEFHAWLRFCHDRRLLFCDAVSANDASESTDSVVVLRPTWLLEACQNLLSAESRCCVQVSNNYRSHSAEFSAGLMTADVLVSTSVSPDIMAQYKLRDWHCCFPVDMDIYGVIQDRTNYPEKSAWC